MDQNNSNVSGSGIPGGTDPSQIGGYMGNQFNMVNNGDLQALLAQFQGVNPGIDGKKSSPHHKFLQEDDFELRRLVTQFGTSDWKAVAAHMNGRSARQCRDRWKNYLAPDVNNAPWTEDEDRLLDIKVAEMGRKWSQIAKFFPGRTDYNIKNRYVSHSTRSSRQIGIPMGTHMTNEMQQYMGNVQGAPNG